MTDYSTENSTRRSGYERVQIPLHFGMGSVYIIFGILVLYVKYFGSIQLSSGIAYTLGGLMALYGAFRIWRGIVMLRQQNRRQQR
ncbi:MAG TPA: hypothetical protein VL098_11695 [Flavipsychrobacter sp.]|nr:hypothetical protein [Flavipsychrobacter sp.]